ncbi:hypothetical protein ISS85_02055 [Candidatus Microgenomates bacterium]|nr:hypothetical protein [Candidatus Microgenomates bacterium]
MNLEQFTKNRRLIISLAIFLFLIGGILVTTHLAKQPQLIQKEAAGGEVVLSLSPETGSYIMGEEFNVDILLNTDNKPVVAVDISLTFDPTKLQVQSVTPGSFFQDQIVFKNEIGDGKILLSLGSFTPFTGSGIYGTISFLALEVGDTQMVFDETPHTKVAQQGGGDVLGETTSGSYTITELLSPTPTEGFTPTQTPTPTPNCLEQTKMGDYNCDGAVNLHDFETWKNDYLEAKTDLSFFEYWRRAFYSN